MYDSQIKTILMYDPRLAAPHWFDFVESTHHRRQLHACLFWDKSCDEDAGMIEFDDVVLQLRMWCCGGALMPGCRHSLGPSWYGSSLSGPDTASSLCSPMSSCFPPSSSSSGPRPQTFSIGKFLSLSLYFLFLFLLLWSDTYPLLVDLCISNSLAALLSFSWFIICGLSYLYCIGLLSPEQASSPCS